jgi:hypothetical protein
MILRSAPPGPAERAVQAPGLAFGCGTLKDGGEARHGSF